MVVGASPLQAFCDVALPVIRPGIVVVVVWALRERLGQLPHPVHPARAPTS